jgi:hypothetical protein
LEDRGVDGKIILKWILEKWDGAPDWFDLAQDRDRWRVLVNAIIKFRVPSNVENFLSSWETVSFSGSTLLHRVSYYYFTITEHLQQKWWCVFFLVEAFAANFLEILFFCL